MIFYRFGQYMTLVSFFSLERKNDAFNKLKIRKVLLLQVDILKEKYTQKDLIKFPFQLKEIYLDSYSDNLERKMLISNHGHEYLNF